MALYFIYERPQKIFADLGPTVQTIMLRTLFCYSPIFGNFELGQKLYFIVTENFEGRVNTTNFLTLI